MQLSVISPNFDQDFLNKLQASKAKGVEVDITSLPNGQIFVLVEAGARGRRNIGKFVFDKDDGSYILIKKHVIEREYYPFEVAIARLVKYAKRNKIGYILWNG